MTALVWFHYQPFVAAPTALAWLVVGALIGRLHYLTLHWSVRRLTTGQSWASALVIQLIRFAALAALLGLTARSFGAMPMLIVTAGILSARSPLFRSGGQQP